jgi:hypothetical protein
MSVRHRIQMQGLRIELGGKALDSLLIDAQPTGPVGLPTAKSSRSRPPATGEPATDARFLQTYVPSARLT